MTTEPDEPNEPNDTDELAQFGIRRTGRMWAMDLGAPPAQAAPAQPATFGHLPSEAELVEALGEDTRAEFASRLARGSRCHAAWVDGRLAAYGWVSFKEEFIGEQHLRLQLLPGEAYIWDCVTLPDFRRQGLYTALLTHMAGALHGEGLARAWIGADLSNAPSQRGIENAGFTPVADLLEGRVLSLRLVWLEACPAAPPSLVADCRRALFGKHDQAWKGVDEG